MKLGDKVTSKKTGPLAVGYVMSIMAPSYYMASCGMTGNSRWDEVYPDWQKKMLVGVGYETPQKNLSLDEFCAGYNVQKTPEVIAIYNKIVPDRVFIVYPADDLELFQSWEEYSQEEQ
jgi:hypothetical protein